MAEPTLEVVARQIGETQAALTVVWTVAAAILVLLMQVGFAMLETGLTRAKNAAHTMGMNLLVFALGAASFFLVGFGLQMGGSVAGFGAAAALNQEFTFRLAGHDFGLFGMTGFALPTQAF